MLTKPLRDPLAEYREAFREEAVLLANRAGLNPRIAPIVARSGDLLTYEAWIAECIETLAWAAMLGRGE